MFTTCMITLSQARTIRIKTKEMDNYRPLATRQDRDRYTDVNAVRICSKYYYGSNEIIQTTALRLPYIHEYINHSRELI